MAIPQLSSRLPQKVDNRITNDAIRDEVGKKYFGFSDMASSNWAGGEKAQQKVNIAERMRAAARFSELEGDIMQRQVRSEIESSPKFIGPKIPDATAGIFSGDLFDAAKKTLNWEARRDKQGNLAVYQLPSGDMGGTYEVAGINDRYHPEAARTLRDLPPEEREAYALNYIIKYTEPVTSKLPEAYRPFFQDLAFNRGPAGSVKFLQRAIGVKDDGVLGPMTLDKLKNENPADVMRKVSLEQLKYEQSLKAKNPERAKFYRGLENRIMNRNATFSQFRASA